MKEIVLEALRTLGFIPEALESSGYRFEFERINILYLPDPQDPNFLLLTIPNIFEADDDHFTAGLLISERINSSLKYVKAYFYKESIWLFYEHELTGQEDMEVLLRSMIYQLCQAYTFAQKAIEDFEQMKAEYQEE